MRQFFGYVTVLRFAAWSSKCLLPEITAEWSVHEQEPPVSRTPGEKKEPVLLSWNFCFLKTFQQPLEFEMIPFGRGGHWGLPQRKHFSQGHRLISSANIRKRARSGSWTSLWNRLPLWSRLNYKLWSPFNFPKPETMQHTQGSFGNLWKKLVDVCLLWKYTLQSGYWW